MENKKQKLRVLLVSPMADGQSGTFIHNTFIDMGHKVAYFDWRHLLENKGQQGMNLEFVKAMEQLKPDITLIVKGVGITGETIKKCREIHNHFIAGWIFDTTLAGTFIKDADKYVDMLKELDVFYTVDNDAVPELKELGVNCKYLAQACYPNSHSEQVLNNVQKRKYGADIAFIGTVGGIHPNREKILERIAEEGFKFKIYGDVVYKENTEPDFVKEFHTGFAVVDDMHSTVVNSSKIVIGLDGWDDRDMAWSLRLYKVLCAGGFYLTTHTKGIEKVFKPGEHLDTYKNEDELIEKIVKYLNDDELREKIARAGQKEVLEKHNQNIRIKVILDDFENSIHLNS